jgi:DNA-binding transcriptional ArsR family regulator
MRAPRVTAWGDPVRKDTKTSPKSRAALPSWAVDACHLEHEKASHLVALQAVALAYVNCGRSQHEFTADAKELAEAAARDDKAPRSATRKLRRAWEKAVKRVAENPAQFDAFAVRRTITAIRKQADSEHWKGQAGNTDRAVLEAVLNLAEERNTLQLALSVRAISEGCGVGKSTAARALPRLTARGYLTLVKAGSITKGEASVFAVHDREADGTQVSPRWGESMSQLVPRLEFLTCDAFAPQALGRTGARVLAYLDELEERSPQAIAEASGLHIRTVRRALIALEAVGIAQRHRQGRGFVWTSRLDAFDAEEVASAYGTKGRAEHRRRQHELEREGFTEWRDAVERERRERFLMSKSSRIERALRRHRRSPEALAVSA